MSTAATRPAAGRAWVRSAVRAIAGIIVMALLASGCDRTAPRARGLELLRTNASQIVDAHGRRVVLRGVTVYAIPFYDAGGGRPDPDLQRVTTRIYQGRTTVFRAIAASGANVVRIPVSSSSYSHDSYGLGGRIGYLNRLQAIVAAARQAGLYVIVAWWDAAGWGPSFSADEARQAPMMAAVAAAYRSDAAVMFEPFNEPNGISWSTWQEVVASTLTLWRRQIRYRGILVLDTIDYSWAFDPGQAARVLAEDRALHARTSDIAFANHRYANTSSCFCGAEATEWDGTVGRYAATFPILGDEYGNYNPPYAPQPAWTSQFFAHIGSTAIANGLDGALAFVWNWVDPNSMTEPDASTLTPYGRIVQSDILRRSP